MKRLGAVIKLKEGEITKIACLSGRVRGNETGNEASFPVEV
jgi:hypothetical protein